MLLYSYQRRRRLIPPYFRPPGIWRPHPSRPLPRRVPQGLEGSGRHKVSLSIKDFVKCSTAHYHFPHTTAHSLKKVLCESAGSPDAGDRFDQGQAVHGASPAHFRRPDVVPGSEVRNAIRQLSLELGRRSAKNLTSTGM